MSEKDTISMQLVREALLQTCPQGKADAALLRRAGIDERSFEQADARVGAGFPPAIQTFVPRH